VLTIREVDPQDEAAFQAYWDCEQAAARPGRPHAALRSWPVLRNLAREPSPYYRHVFLAAYVDDRIVGTADLGLSLQDNLRVGGVEINVEPGHRRRGIGRALYAEVEARALAEGRSTLVGEAHLVGVDHPSIPFAEALGFAVVHHEDHFVCELPRSPREVARLHQAIGGHAGDYEVVTWATSCPPELVDAFCSLKSQMTADVPLGEIDYEPVVFDEARLRSQETRMALGYLQVVAAARHRADGELAGYSIVLMDHSDDLVLQDDTLVMPAHRGRRLGLLLKVATLELIHRDHPERIALHTWSAVDNDPMQRTNRDFGYRPVERMHEMQRTIG
jgi:GNAT superfamily N-acetyltransferase